jgi:hypothetical protein
MEFLTLNSVVNITPPVETTGDSLNNMVLADVAVASVPFAALV